MNKENKISALRKFFTISVAAFEMHHTVSAAFGFKGQKSYMHRLHLVAKKEIEKDQPDLNKINILLARMEDWAEANLEKPAKLTLIHLNTIN